MSHSCETKNEEKIIVVDPPEKAEVESRPTTKEHYDYQPDPERTEKTKSVTIEGTPNEENTEISEEKHQIQWRNKKRRASIDPDFFTAKMTFCKIRVRRKHVIAIFIVETVFLLLCLFFNARHYVDVFREWEETQPKDPSLPRRHKVGTQFVAGVTFIEIFVGLAFEVNLVLAIWKRSRKWLNIHTYGESAAVPLLFLNGSVILGLCYGPFEEHKFLGRPRPLNIILVAFLSYVMGFLEILFLCCLQPVARKRGPTTTVLCVHGGSDEQIRKKSSLRRSREHTVSSDSFIVNGFTDRPNPDADDFESAPVTIRSGSDSSQPGQINKNESGTSRDSNQRVKWCPITVPTSPTDTSAEELSADENANTKSLGRDSGRGSAEHTLLRSVSGSDELYAVPSKTGSPESDRSALAISDHRELFRKIDDRPLSVEYAKIDDVAIYDLPPDEEATLKRQNQAIYDEPEYASVDTAKRRPPYAKPASQSAVEKVPVVPAHDPPASQSAPYSVTTVVIHPSRLSGKNDQSDINKITQPQPLPVIGETPRKEPTNHFAAKKKTSLTFVSEEKHIARQVNGGGALPRYWANRQPAERLRSSNSYEGDRAPQSYYSVKIDTSSSGDDTALAISKFGNVFRKA